MTGLHPSTWTDGQIILAGVAFMIGWASGVALICVLFWSRLTSPLTCTNCWVLSTVRKQAAELRRAWVLIEELRASGSTR